MGGWGVVGCGVCWNEGAQPAGCSRVLPSTGCCGAVSAAAGSWGTGMPASPEGFTGSG